MDRMMESNWDVIIIGAGISGLTASIFLAKAGLRTLVLEKGQQPGGRGVSTTVDGARLNLGAHALYKGALDILREVGVTPSGAMPKQNPVLVFRRQTGEPVPLPLMNLLLGSFLGWSEKSELLRFYSGMRKIDASALNNISLKDYLDSRLRSPHVRNFVQALIRVSSYSHAPSLVSAGAVIGQLQQAQVLYLDGGWQSMLDQLLAKAKAAGVTIRCGSSVRKIVGTRPHMCVELKDATRLGAAFVLSTAGPSETLAMLDPALRPDEAALYEGLVPVRAACLDMVMNGLPRPAVRFSLGVDDPLYFANHSATAKLTDHPGHSVIHLMKYLPPGVDSNAASNEQELERLLDLLQPGWRKHVVHRRFLPRMLVSHALPTAESGGLAGRPAPAMRGRNGLYVAGDWVGSEGLLLQAAISSAREAALGIIAAKGTIREGNAHEA